MSTRAIICTTDGPDKGCTIWDHDQHVDARHSLEQDPDGWGSEYGDAALDEIERLHDLTTIPNENLERLARCIYARFKKSSIPAHICYWMWDHGLVSETTKARYENIAHDVIATMTMLYRDDEEPNA